MSLFDIRSTSLPYCLKMEACGRIVILNREYKPVGFYTREFIKYEQYPVQLTVRITNKIAGKISCNWDGNLKEIFLYNDSCLPLSSSSNWKAYCVRLFVLASLRIQESSQNVNSIKGIVIRARNLKDAKTSF